MTRMRINEKLEREVAAVDDLPREELVERWVKVFGCAPPKGIKRGLLERSAAWHLQARRLGGLSSAARKALKTAPPGKGTGHRSPGSAIASLAKSVTLKPGTRLVRDWNGRTHVVDVAEAGFVFDGKTYRSLSAIARRITGARWSGPRFFGL